jgi:hypothetical protein
LWTTDNRRPCRSEQQGQFTVKTRAILGQPVVGTVMIHLSTAAGPFHPVIDEIHPFGPIDGVKTTLGRECVISGTQRAGNEKLTQTVRPGGKLTPLARV